MAAEDLGYFCHIGGTAGSGLNNSAGLSEVGWSHDRRRDNDKLPDGWEIENFGNLTAAGPGTVYGSPAYTDTDADGLNDLEEYTLGTDPMNPDSNADGLSDGDSVKMGLSPSKLTYDANGVPTSVKVMWDGKAGYTAGADMDPLKTDTDGDGVSDLMEIAAGSDPLNAADSDVIRISKVTFDAMGRPVVEWNIYANQGSVAVQFVVESSQDLKTWVQVGTYLSPGTSSGTATVTDVVNTGKKVYYKLRLSIGP